MRRFLSSLLFFFASAVVAQNPLFLQTAFNGAATASMPTFAPVAGSYVGTQTVTISDSTPSATVCYTTDGSTPTANGAGTCTHGSTYASPVSVASSETLQALASKAGYQDSSVSSAIYSITIAVSHVQTCTPVFTNFSTLAITCSGVASSDTIVLGVIINSSSHTINGCTTVGSACTGAVDSLGNTVKLVGTLTNATFTDTAYILLIDNASAGNHTITYTTDVGTSLHSMLLADEYSNAGSSALDVSTNSACASSCGTTLSDTITTTSNFDVIWAMCEISTGTINAGTTPLSMTARGSKTGVGSVLTVDALAGSAGSYTPTCTQGSSTAYWMFAVGLK